MPKADHTETFTEMRDRLMEVHDWDRKIATIAARYYLGVENVGDMRERTQTRPIHLGVVQRPDLTLGMAHEIAMLR